MSAPTDASKTAPRKTESGRKAAAKTAARAASGTAKRGRTAAAERAYARREDRRAQGVRTSERPRQQREIGGLRGPLRVVTPKAKQLQERITLSRVPFVVAVMALMAVGLIATLSLSIAGVSGSYELRQGKGEITALSEQKEQLIRQNSYLDSTPALQKRAAEWGWVPAPEPAHLVRDPNGAVRVVGEPMKAQAPEPPAPPPAPPTPPQVAAPPQATAPPQAAAGTQAAAPQLAGSQPAGQPAPAQVSPAAQQVPAQQAPAQQSGAVPAGQPAAGQPAAGQPAAGQPAVEQPVGGQPAAGQALADQPVPVDH